MVKKAPLSQILPSDLTKTFAIRKDLETIATFKKSRLNKFFPMPFEAFIL